MWWVWLRVASDALVARRNSPPTLALPSGRGVVVGRGGVLRRGSG